MCESVLPIRPYLNGLTPNCCSHLRPARQSRAQVVERLHFRRVELRAADVGLVPALEIGELVVGRNGGMGFAVTLGLGDFGDRFPFRACLRIGAVERLAAKCLVGKHQTAGKIAVVRHVQHLPAGLLLVICKIMPQGFRIGMVEGGQRFHLQGTVGIVAEQNDPMQIVAAWRGTPLVADKGGEQAWLIVFFRGGNGKPPGRGVHARRMQCGLLRAGILHHRCKQSKPAGAAGVEFIIPFHAYRIGKDFGRAVAQGERQAHVIRMIADQQEIIGAPELGRYPSRGNHFLTARKTECVLRAKASAEQPGIEGIVGVEMQIAPQHALRMFRPCRRRVWLAVLGGWRLGRNRVGLGARRQQCEGEGGKDFLFEEKKQKTLIYLASALLVEHCTISTSLLIPFFKKDHLLFPMH